MTLQEVQVVSTCNLVVAKDFAISLQKVLVARDFAASLPKVQVPRDFAPSLLQVPSQDWIGADSCKRSLVSPEKPTSESLLSNEVPLRQPGSESFDFFQGPPIKLASDH